MEKKRSRMGRPPLPKAQCKSIRIAFRVTPGLNRALVRAAKREGKPLGRYISEALQAMLEGDT
jgi:predicted HicB family RNase H-like nuclease